MEQLADMMSRSSVDQEEEVSEPGRKTELKTYIVESNSPQLSASQFDKFSISVQDTGIDEIKILNLTLGGRLTQFYLDMADKRFWLLHTHGLADEADRIMNRFISNPKYQIDSTWFSSGMLSKVSNLIGNRFDGAGIDYSTLFDSEEEMEVPMEELKVTVYGYRAFEALKRMADAESVKN